VGTGWKPVVSVWIRQKHRSCVLALNIYYPDLTQSTCPSCIQVQETTSDLGVVIDSRLSLGEHVASVSRSSYYQLRQLRPVVRCLSDDATKTLVHAFIACRLDYCNALFLASRTNCFATCSPYRLVIGTKRSDHISPMLRQLHWLSVRQRVVFKIATLVYRSWSGHAPGYLADDCQLVTDARARLLLSANVRTLTVHRTFSCFGDRTFALLPQEFRTVSHQTYKKQSYRTPGSGGRWRHFNLDHPTMAHCELFLTVLCRNILTYLITYWLWSLWVL